MSSAVDPTLLEITYASLDLSPPLPEARPPVLIILTGLPGSGKTHLACALVQRAPFTLVGSDPLRAVLVEEPLYSPTENRLVYAVIDALLWRLMRERRDTIYDAVNLSERRRVGLRTLALDAGSIPLTVRTTAPEMLIKQRLYARATSPTAPGESEADWDVYHKLASRAERVAHQHIVLDTSQDITPTMEEILSRIQTFSSRLTRRLSSSGLQ